jgi:hypothetical protein
LIYSDRSLRIAKELGFPEEMGDAAGLLSTIYEAQGNGMKAIQMHRLYIKMRDSVQNKKTQEATILNRLKYEYEKKAAADSVANAKENEVRDAEAAKNQAEVREKRNQQYALCGGLVLVLIFAGFMFNRFRITQKQKQVIEMQKHEVEEKNKEVTASINYAKRIQQSLLPTEKYIERNLNKLNREK